MGLRIRTGIVACTLAQVRDHKTVIHTVGILSLQGKVNKAGLVTVPLSHGTEYQSAQGLKLTDVQPDGITKEASKGSVVLF